MKLAKSAVGAWSSKNFRLLFVGQTVSALGNTLVPVALAFAVLDLTGSATDLGLVLGAQSVAMVACLLPAGVYADRLPRRLIMVGSDSVRCGAQALMGILLVASHPSTATLAVLAAVTGAAAAVFSPASTGLTPSLVPVESLQQANALQQTAAAAAGIAGPAVAGVLVVTVGPGWALIANAATFAVSVLMLTQLRLDHVPRPEPQHPIDAFKEGWSDFWSRKWLRTVVMGASVFNLCYAAYTVLGPVVSDRDYHGARTWATVSTAGAVGSVVLGLVSARLRPRHPLRVAVPCVAAAALEPLAFAAHLPVAVVALAAALAGGGLMVFESLWTTTMQRVIPPERLSRVSSYDWFGSLVAYPIGLALAGPLAAQEGVRPLLWTVGGLLFALTFAMLFARSVRDISFAGPT